MHSQSALTELPSPNLAPYLSLHPIQTSKFFFVVLELHNRKLRQNCRFTTMLNTYPGLATIRDALRTLSKLAVAGLAQRIEMLWKPFLPALKWGTRGWGSGSALSRFPLWGRDWKRIMASQPLWLMSWMNKKSPECSLGNRSIIIYYMR